MTTVKVNLEATEEVHKVGDYFLSRDNELFILCMPKAERVALISVKDGLRWSELVLCCTLPQVTIAEFKTITQQHEFTKVSSVKISVGK